MNHKIKKKYILKKSVKIALSKLLIIIIIFLIGMILTKNNDYNKNIIKEKLFERNIPFQKIKGIYEKYFGNVLSISKEIKKTEPVFKETIQYIKKEPKENGIELKVEENYLVPSIESGIIINIKEDAIIMEQVDGIEVTYKNIEKGDFSLYDYIEKGEIIGKVTNDELFLTFQKNGEIINYQDYL